MLNDQVVISIGSAILVALPPTIIALTGLIVAMRNGDKTDKVKTLVNGRMDQLLELSKAQAHSEGKLAGHQEAVELIKKENSSNAQ